VKVAEPLPPGRPSTPVPIDSKQAAQLVGIAAREAVLEAAGLPLPARASDLPRAVLWREGGDSLLVEVGQIRVETGDGLVSVAVPVRCDQIPRGSDVITVDFVLGTPERPTGMLVAATEPRGPIVVVRRWGEALTALAWQALLDMAGGVARAAGSDRDGSPLVPTVLTATRAGLAVGPQARHELDRVRTGRVIAPTALGREFLR
jgi:hypothetical protein